MIDFGEIDLQSSDFAKVGSEIAGHHSTQAYPVMTWNTQRGERILKDADLPVILARLKDLCCE